MKVVILNKMQAYKGFFTLEKSTLKFEKTDGSLSDEIVRENFFRGDSVAALVYDSKIKKILFVRQFRYPVYTVDPENSWILELVAGSCDKDEHPANAMSRELFEELHVTAEPEKLDELGSFFTSPGGTSERIFLYALETDLSRYDNITGGVDEENEDIEIILSSFDEAFLMLEQSAIFDAKTIIALQHLKLILTEKV